MKFNNSYKSSSNRCLHHFHFSFLYTALYVTGNPIVSSKSFQRQKCLYFGDIFGPFIAPSLLIESLAYNTWLVLPYFSSKYLLSLKLVLAARFALNIEFVLSSHQSTWRNRCRINKSNKMNKALGGLFNEAEVSVCLQEIQ